MSEEETIKRLQAESEVAYETYRMALSVWQPAQDAAEASRRALNAAHAVCNKLDMDLYRLTKKGEHNE